MLALALFALGAILMVVGMVDDITSDFTLKGKVAAILAVLAVLALSFAAHAEVRQDEVLSLVNEVRAEAGVAPLVYADELQAGADVRAAESAELRSHTRPDGTDWWTVDERIYGENLGWGYGSAEELVNAWVASPTHFANLVNPKFHTMALGIAGDHYAQELGY